MGDSANARKDLARLLEFSKRAHVPSERIAQAYIAVGENDRAIQWLERAFDERSIGTLWLPMATLYDPLRSDPRFAALVQRIAASRP